MKKTSFSYQIIYKSFLLGSCFLCATTFAANSVFPNEPAISLTGTGGNNGSDFMGYADGLVPVYGDATNIWYVDPQGLYHNSTDYAGSVGLGWRQMFNADNILGAYVFGDYNHAPSGHGFWFVSPGLERLGSTFDFHTNLYIPVGDKKVNTGIAYGDQIGIYDDVSFQGHTQYDETFYQSESVGTGADAQIGYRLPFNNNTKFYLGGYYFDPKDADSIKGGTAKLEVPFSEYLSAAVSDGYDNVSHNTVKVGLTLSFGSRTTGFNYDRHVLGLDYTMDNILQNRMYDSVHRNIASTDGGWQTNQPISEIATPTGTISAELTNISFFEPTGSSQGDGTYENPYIGFNQTNVDAANTAGNTNFYLNTGTYTNTGSITLTNDSVYGRDNYNGNPFVQPASGSARPLLDGFTGNGLILEGSNVLDALQLVGNLAGTGITITSQPDDGETTNNIQNTDVSKFNNGVYISNTNTSSTMTVSAVNSNFFDNQSYGFNVIGSANSSAGPLVVSVDNSTFNSNGSDGFHYENQGSEEMDVFIQNSQFDGNGANGLNMTNTAGSTGGMNLTVQGSTFDNNSTNGMAYQKFGGNTMGATITDSEFSNNNNAGISMINQTGSRNSTMSLSLSDSTIDYNNNGFYYASQGSGTMDVTVSNSHFDNNASSGLYMKNGPNSDATMNLDVDNSTFNDNGADGLTVTTTSAVLAGSAMNVTVNNSSFNGNADNGLEATTNDSTNSTITVTATNSSFDNNGNYGVYASSGAVNKVTMNLQNNTFSGNTTGATNESDSSGSNVAWNVSSPAMLLRGLFSLL